MSQEQPGQEAGGEWLGDVGSHIPSTADTQGRLRLGSDLNTFSIQELTGAPGLMLSRHCTPPRGWGAPFTPPSQAVLLREVCCAGDSLATLWDEPQATV